MSNIQPIFIQVVRKPERLCIIKRGRQAAWQRIPSRQASLPRSSIFPTLIFSGSTLPVEVMPKAMQKIVSVFPLTQGLTMMKNTFLGVSTGSILLPLCVMIGVTALCTVLAVRFFKWE